MQLEKANERIKQLESLLNLACQHEEQEKARFERLFEMTPLGYQSLDESGNFIEVNDAWLKKLGYSKEEVIGKNFSEFLVPEWQQHFADIFPRFKAVGEVLGVEFEMFRKDGTVIRVSYTGRIGKRKDGSFQQTHCVFRDITEEKKRAQALLESELKWHSVLLNTPQLGVSLTPVGKITFVNDWFLKVTGWTQDEIIGKNWFDLFVSDESREDVARVFEATLNDVNGSNTSSYENEILKKDGSSINAAWFNVLSKNQDGHVIDVTCLGIDLTERNRARQQIFKSEKKYRLLAEGLPALVAEFSPDWTIKYANRALSDFFHIPYEAAVASTLQSFVNTEIAKAVATALSEVSSESPTSSFIHEFEHEGRSHWLEWNIRGGFDANEQLENILAVGFDITDKVHTQKRLQAARDMAQAANKAKSEFLANMSHEIRTPLNGIVGMLQLLEATELGEEQREYAHAAVRSSDRLTHLLSDILDLSRVEAGKMPLDIDKFDIKSTVSGVCQFFELAASQKGLDLFCDIDPNLPSSLLGDRIRVQQVLNNLVGNAVKYTHSGQVRLGAYSQSIDEKRHRVLFVISDTGIGIPDESIGELFQPFTQVSGGYTRRYEGAGLGLAICRRLVDLMGGSLSVDSAKGQGTTMIFSLPFERAPGGREGNETASDNEGGVAVAGLKTLVAEDDYVNSCAIRIMLEKVGFQVETASTGREAVEALKHTKFDVVLMDIQMPEMNGIEATKAIRDGEAGTGNIQIPIVAMTAYAMAGDQEIFLNAGMNSYVPKPVDKSGLLDAIAEAITNPVNTKGK